MKVFGIALPKAASAVLSTIVGVGVLTTGAVALVPQARIALQGPVSTVRRIPALGSAASRTYQVEGPSMAPTYPTGDYLTR